MLSFAACEQSTTTTSQIAPTPITTSTPPLQSVPPPLNWLADRVFVGVSNPAGCPNGARVGDSRNDVGWSIKIDGGAIKLDEDVGNWPNDDVPYSGTLSGTQFEASYSVRADSLQTACQWGGGTLTGEFNSDFTRFAATETLVWGPSESEVMVQARWTGRAVMR
jgi:hypothetical protein